MSYFTQGLLRFLDDRSYIRLKYFHIFKKLPNLKNPITFSEKLQWLKLNDRNPLYTILVDKYKVKKYVSDIIGAQYVIPLLGVWNSFSEIDFSMLPNKFVLKTNHGKGGIVLCQEKSKLDLKIAKREIDKSLKNNFYIYSREWPYKNVPRKVFAEEYMVDESGFELKDYKFYCFDGVPKYVLVASNRYKHVYFDYFDINFKHIDCLPEDNALQIPQKPKNYEKMVELASILSKNIPQVRIDFYNCDGQIYFGEFTMFDSGGFENKREWDKIFGENIDLKKAYCFKK